MMINVPKDIEKIITVANDLACGDEVSGKTTEVIAAAFVLERLEFLPYGYNIIEAWERIEDWQCLIPIIKVKYSDLLVPW